MIQLVAGEKIDPGDLVTVDWKTGAIMKVRPKDLVVYHSDWIKLESPAPVGRKAACDCLTLLNGHLPTCSYLIEA